MKKDATLTRKQIRRRVNVIRSVMRIAAGRMVDMEHAIGKDTWFETEMGPVRALTYGFENEATTPLVSPAYATEEMVSHFPPTLVITAGQDSLAAETERFKDTLCRAGVDVTFKRFEEAIHGFTMITPQQGKKLPALYQQSQKAWQMMVDFVNRYI